jgi:hypothetical protein
MQTKPLPSFAQLDRWDTCPYVVRGGPPAAQISIARIKLEMRKAIIHE